MYSFVKFSNFPACLLHVLHHDFNGYLFIFNADVMSNWSSHYMWDCSPN